MKRRIGLLLAIASAATVGVFAPPVAADEDACAGTGLATLNDGLGAVGLFPKLTTKFHFQLTTGVCVAKPGGLVADGYVTGNCGNSYGGGTTDNDHDFAFTSTGTVLVLTGEVLGIVSAAVDATKANNSCLNKTARDFIITGTVVKHHFKPCTTNTAALTTDCDVVEGVLVGDS